VANFTPDKVIQVQDEAAARAELARVEARAEAQGFVCLASVGDGRAELLAWNPAHLALDAAGGLLPFDRQEPAAVVRWMWGA
jgi:hypothetical protein